MIVLTCKIIRYYITLYSRSYDIKECSEFRWLQLRTSVSRVPYVPITRHGEISILLEPHLHNIHIVLWPTWVYLISGSDQKIDIIPWITIVHWITKTVQKRINCTVSCDKHYLYLRNGTINSFLYGLIVPYKNELIVPFRK